jgi:hypothetical protein
MSTSRNNAEFVIPSGVFDVRNPSWNDGDMVCVGAAMQLQLGVDS